MIKHESLSVFREDLKPSCRHKLIDHITLEDLPACKGLYTEVRVVLFHDRQQVKILKNKYGSSGLLSKNINQITQS